jgi:hypothetical protein
MNSSPETRDRILEAYVLYLKVEGEPPKSVFTFCQSLGLSERDFYETFASFAAAESTVWGRMITRVIEAVKSGSEWSSFSAKQKMLSFFYAFFEASLDYRSLMLMRLEPLRPLEKATFLHHFESYFKEFVREILRQGQESREVADRQQFSPFYPEAVYNMFRGVISFHLKDTSQGFEKTDALIEKSVALTFDLLRSSAIESAFDLAKMLWQGPRSSAASCSATA